MPTNRPKILHPQLVSLYEYWLDSCGPTDVPIAHDLDIAALRPWMTNLVVVERASDGHYRYAYYGSAFEAAFHQNLAGQSLASLPSEQRILLEAEYDMALSSAEPHRRHYTASFDGHTATWERLVLPLAGQGTSAEKLLVAAYQLEEGTGN